MEDLPEKSKGFEKKESVGDEASSMLEEVLSGTTSNIWVVISSIIAISLGSFHLYTAYAGQLLAWQQRAIHLVVMLLLFFTTSMSRRQSKLVRLVTLAAIVLTVAVGTYMLRQTDAILLRGGDPPLSDVIACGVLIFLVFLASSRAMGPGMTLIGGGFLLYCFAGFLFPGGLYHRGFSIERVTGFLFNSTTGVMGVPIGIVSTYIIVFIIFGAFLAMSGGGQFFIDFALSLTRRLPGGAAMSAVVASALFGTVSGSAAANVAGTGTFTIPLMKKMGYSPEMAGGIEAAASTGGMIMPPVMASAAFIMAEFTRVPYVTIMKIALVPALMYFLSVGLAVYLHAKRTGIGIPGEDSTPQGTLQLLRQKGFYLLPVVVLIGLLIRGLSPDKSALYAIVVLIALSYVGRSTRMGPMKILAALESGVRNAMSISIVCAVAGVIVGSINATGIGLKASSLILTISGGRVFLVLLFTAIMAIILGMGMNASAVYIIVVSLLVPGLVGMGIQEMAAHLFAFYFGIVSAITPPVALASYAAAGLAKGDMTRTSLIAMRLAFVALIVPFVFAYDPGLLLIGSTSDIIVTIARTGLFIILMNFGIESYAFGHLNTVERFSLLLASALLLPQVLPLRLVGLGIGITVLSLHVIGQKRTNRYCE